MAMDHPTKAAQARAVSASELARLLGKHRSTVAGWVSRGCPVVSEPDRGRGVAGQLDPAAVVAWLLAEERQRAEERLGAEVKRLEAALAGGAEAGADVSKEEALRRKRVAEAALLELQLARSRGEVLDRGEVVGEWRTQIMRCRNHLRGIPKRGVAEGWLPRELARRLLKRVDEALNELAGDGTPTADDEADAA